jgi:hypothetical protein
MSKTKKKDITFFEFQAVARMWKFRELMGENLKPPQDYIDKGFFAFVDGVLYRYVG